MFFEDPADHAWHSLRWTGLPTDGEIPAFSDARVREMLRETARRGLRPRNDRELLPVLLDLVAAQTPVNTWPTQMTKTQKAERARELARARQAALDRPDKPPAGTGQPSAVVTSLELARSKQDAIDADRRRRREAAVPSRPSPPPLLGESLRRNSLFLLPDEDTDREPGDLAQEHP